MGLSVVGEDPSCRALQSKKIIIIIKWLVLYFKKKGPKVICDDSYLKKFLHRKRNGWKVTYQNTNRLGEPLPFFLFSNYVFSIWISFFDGVLIFETFYQAYSAAAAKSLQSCPTLCDPIDGSPPGSPFLGFSRQEHWSGLPFPSPMHESEKWKWSHSVVSDSQRPHGR